MVEQEHFKNAHELLNLRALKFSKLYENRIFQCIGKIFCKEFNMHTLNLNLKYFTHALKGV